MANCKPGVVRSCVEALHVWHQIDAGLALQCTDTKPYFTFSNSLKVLKEDPTFARAYNHMAFPAYVK
jgi:hypothetical protein